MPDLIKWKIEGLKEAQAALRRLPDAVARRIVLRILSNRLKPVALSMKTLAPEGEGELRKSIKVGTKLTPSQRRTYRKYHPDDIDMFVGAGPQPQAITQEFGTAHHSPQAFARPSWDRYKNGMTEGLANDFWVEIRKAIAKG